MTVKELIKFLEVQPQEARVVVFTQEQSEDGYDEVDKAELVDLVYFPESHGAEYFTPEPNKKEKTIKAVRLW